MTFAEGLKDRRITKGWSQQQLSIKTGIKRETIAAYESGRIEPSLKKFYLICQVLGIEAFKTNTRYS